MILIKNGLFKKSLLYIFFNGLNGLIPFLLLPILTEYLAPNEYGTVNLFQTTVAFLTPLVGLSMGFNIDRLFFKVSKEKLAITIGNMLFLLLIMVIGFTLIIGVGSAFFEYSFIGLPITWLIMIPILSGFSTINIFNLIILRNSDKVKEFGFWQILLTVINLILSLLLVVVFLKGWEGRAYGIATSFTLVGLGSLYNIYNKGYITFDFYKDEIKEIIKLCLPLLLHGIGTFIIFQSNRYFINGFIGKDAVGIFGVATAFAAIMGILQDGIAKTVNPWFYKNLNNMTQELKSKVVKMNVSLNILYLVLAVIIYFVAILLLRILIDDKFQSAGSLIFILLMASAFNGMYKISSVYFIHLSKTALLSNITMFVALLSIGLNYLFIVNFGLIGACYSFCLCLFTQFLLTLYFAQKIYPLPINELLTIKKNKVGK